MGGVAAVQCTPLLVSDVDPDPVGSAFIWIQVYNIEGKAEFNQPIRFRYSFEIIFFFFFTFKRWFIINLVILLFWIRIHIDQILWIVICIRSMRIHITAPCFVFFALKICSGNPYLKILDLSKLLLRMPIWEKEFSFTPSQSTLKYWSENRSCI